MSEINFNDDHDLFLGYVEPGFSTPACYRSRSHNSKNVMLKKNSQDLFFGNKNKTSCPRRQSVLRHSSRPPWNSPDVMDVEEEGEQQLQEQEEIPTTRTTTSPPPPPSPSRRRICFVSVDNFQPTPIFGINFPEMAPITKHFPLQKKHASATKRLKRSLIFNDLDAEGNDDPDTKGNNEGSFPRAMLTMKRTRYHDHYRHGLLLGETSFVEY